MMRAAREREEVKNTRKPNTLHLFVLRIGFGFPSFPSLFRVSVW